LLERVIRFMFDNIGKIDDKEIDFIVQQGGLRKYYQVALSVR